MEINKILKIGKLRKNPMQLVTSIEQVADPYYIINEIIDETKYEDITSNLNWSTIGIGHKDYQFVRNQIALRTATIGFYQLPNNDERRIASEFFAVSYDDRKTINTDKEQELNWGSFVYNVQESRKKRWDAARLLLSYYFPREDSIRVSYETKNISDDYLVYGIESYELDGVVGLFDYLEGTYSYSATTSFSSVTSWNETIHNKVINIIKYGIYD